MNTEKPKGGQDLFADKYVLYQNVFEKGEEIASYYGFRPIQTPHLEDLRTVSGGLNLISRSTEGNFFVTESEPSREMILRTEGTIGLMRAYIENEMYAMPQPVMLWHKGSFFKKDGSAEGKLRETQEFGIDMIGEPKPIGEALVIQLLILILKELGAGQTVVNINSTGDKECKGEFKRKILSHYKKNFSSLCKECKKNFKENPTSVLDCRESKCLEIKKNAPQAVDSLCPGCKQHFKEVLEFLDSNDINYFLNTGLVKKFDCYSRTVFEIVSEEEKGKDGSPLVLGSGARYDALSKAFGKKEFPSVGGRINADAVVALMESRNISPKYKRVPKIFLIQLSHSAKQKCMGVIEMFRKANIYISQSINKDNLNSQLGIAARLNTPYVLILGQKESLENSIIVRDMATGSQESVPIEKVVEVVKKKLKK
ncbi:hypothetical protein C4572_03730 [Candidatus Parcubacteria bacterium]|nr:MAG: hypothetical protein C4572_03730 [Candidatus Parcubacteria bacterium]